MGRRKREEKERKEHEEYLKLKEAFSVEDEGCDAAEEEDEENMLLNFINYIKETRVVKLEDLAAHFKLKTQEAIDRVTTLLADDDHRCNRRQGEIHLHQQRGAGGGGQVHQAARESLNLRP